MILSAKYELMRKNFRNFAETEFTTEIQEKLDKEGGFDTEMYKKMAKYGFPGIKIPVKYGGQGGDSLAYVLMNEEFARICPVLAIYANTSNSLGGGPLLACGNEKFFQMLICHRLSGQTIIKCLDLLILIFQNSGEAGIFKNTECLFKIIPGNFYKFVQIPYHT